MNTKLDELDMPIRALPSFIEGIRTLCLPVGFEDSTKAGGQEQSESECVASSWFIQTLIVLAFCWPTISAALAGAGAGGVLTAQEDRGPCEMISEPESVIGSSHCRSADTGLFELLEGSTRTRQSRQGRHHSERAIKQQASGAYAPQRGFWAQSVAEFALALTLCGLRRNPQLHREIITNLTPWNYEQPEAHGG